MSSIIGCVAVFDMGLGHGFRNRFSESVTLGNIHLAREYVSTAYFALSSIVSFLYIAMSAINTQINWSEFLNVDTSFEKELSWVFNILSLFFCMKMAALI